MQMYYDVLLGLVIFFVLTSPLVLTYLYLSNKVNKRDMQRERDCKNSLEIIKMTRTNDVPFDICECFDTLDKNLKEMGIELHMDFRGYMTNE